LETLSGSPHHKLTCINPKLRDVHVQSPEKVKIQTFVDQNDTCCNEPRSDQGKMAAALRLPVEILQMMTRGGILDQHDLASLAATLWSAEQEQLDNLMVQVLAESHTSSFNGSSALVAIVPTQRPSRISEWNSRKDPLVARRPIPRWGMTGLRCLPDKRAAIRADGLTFLREFFTRRFDYQEDRFGDLGTDENGWAMVGCAFGSFRS
ncbi:hypothetical protein B0T25DRAFT_607019, partial [Lasiosphaeria hispida]